LSVISSYEIIVIFMINANEIPIVLLFFHHEI
jgi:hypothetical protein